jgi:hypothetical protein
LTRTRLWLSDRRALRDHLVREAAELPTARAWRTLEDGTLVAAIVEAGEPVVIRLARESREDGWEAELGQVAMQLGCADWPHEVEMDGEAGAIRYQEPDRPEMAPCRRTRCTELAPKRKGSFVGVCSRCAEASRLRMGWAAPVFRAE